MFDKLLLSSQSTAIKSESRFLSSASKIAFGSCLDHSQSQKILDTITIENPDIFILLGDNIYGDTNNPLILKEKYKKLGENYKYKKLKAQTDILAIWDDHDYGKNDAGKELTIKNESRKIMLDFFDEPQGSVRRRQKGGIYTSYLYGSKRKVHIILLDTRWSRTSLKETGMITSFFNFLFYNSGPYIRNYSENAKILSDHQWGWLEEKLKVKADVTIIASSIQVLSNFTGWESWENFPKEKQKLINLIKKTRPNYTVLLSGDTHWGEFSRVDNFLHHKLWDITSGALSKTWEKVAPNKNRVDSPYTQENYGLLTFEWGDKQSLLTMSINNKNGNKVMKNKVFFTNSN